MTRIDVEGFRLVTVGEPPEAHAWTIDTATLGEDEVVIEVAGCGVCHTDLGYQYDGVPTRGALPLVLGHEISGTVVAAGRGAQDLLDRAILVPAVLPCGTCSDCTSGRSNVCRTQLMPGNDVDGGFASHIRLGRRWLTPVPGRWTGNLARLSVVADAVSTPYQALLRSGLSAGGVAIVVGCGGVGGYAAQLAKAAGAHLVAIDIDPAKLERMDRLGAGITLRSDELDARTLKRAVRDHAKAAGWPLSGWCIFECSGHPAGQSLAFTLVGPSSTLLVVGYTPQPVEVRLSNLMAHDARALGNWGCAPEHYPALVEEVVAGAVDVVGTTSLRRLSEMPEVFDEVHAHPPLDRVILVPDAVWDRFGEED